MFARTLNRLHRDTRGSTIVEFAIIAPSFMILLMGVFDLGQTVYLRAVMNGAMQEAARDSTLESGPTAEAAIDGMVETRVQHVLRSADLSFDRKSYYDFTDVERPEAINDENANGECDAGETFEDENGNDIWDSDVGSAGFGGARDITMYTVTATYDKLFPLYGLLGLPQEASIEMSTVLKNQPYAQQNGKAVPETKPC